MFFCVKAWADGTTHSYPKYSSPVNYPITLAGNFGEPRPNHFHGGVDIKTDGVEGKPVFSIGDGYVSQVSIGVYGFAMPSMCITRKAIPVSIAISRSFLHR